MGKIFDARMKAEQPASLQADLEFATGPVEIPGERPAATLGAEEPPPTAATGAAVREVPPAKPAPLARKLEEGSFLAPDKHLVSLTDPSSYEAEQYQVLRHIIEQRHQAGLRVVAVTSPTLGDGKTTTAINLAGALAQAPEARVLLVDADLRHPSVAQRLRMAESQDGGLVSAVLNRERSLWDVAGFHRRYNLAVLPAGRLQGTPYEILKSSRLARLFAEARQEFDFVVVDTPPIVACPDCRLIESLVDGFTVVVAAHKTPRKLVEDALDAFTPGKVLGLVFNGDTRRSRYRSYYYANGRRPKAKPAGARPLRRRSS